MIKINTEYTNGFHFVLLIGVHPKKDMIALTSGEDDIRWISFFDFFTKYKEV